MIRCIGKTFVLDTDNTSYILRVLPTGQLEHVYYGRKVEIECEEDTLALLEKFAFAPGNSCAYDDKNFSYSLENICLEMSSYGKGDIREPFIEVVNPDGGRTCDYLYDSYVITEKSALKTLPSSYDESGEAKELVITLKDSYYGLTLELHYSVFEKYNTIVRSSRFINTCDSPVRLGRLMSNQLDFRTDDYVMTYFTGAWGREMMRKDTPVRAGKVSVNSRTGTTSSRANCFVMLSKEHTDEDYGPVYGMNLVYSGNHYEAAEVNSYHKTRFVQGINPDTFEFIVDPGEDFESPEAVMTFSNEGFNGMSLNMHRFVKNCIVRGTWKNKLRPVLLNSWEAAYFDINEEKLVNLAKAGKSVGIELLVMDDGWFGKRNDDTSSLGDWYVNTDKLPNGLKGLCEKINDVGLDFGIWVEPEMVNVDSDLYRAHPDWAMEIPGKAHSEGRWQRVLDFANPQVVEYMTKQMTEVFSSANIAYVKWDMNRNFSDIYSQYLPAERQGETAHRYMMGLYKMMDALTKMFPDILFEGCSGGGNRFDLGILSYFPQIWASDDSDALYRVNGQTGYSYGYPMSTVTAHVSICPNHQTGRITPLETRFNVAAFGVFGYEYNLCSMTEDELEEIRQQIKTYKNWQEVLLYGDFYRGRSQGTHEWTCVSPDRKRAVGMIMHELVVPNDMYEQYSPKGLDEKTKYIFTNGGDAPVLGETEVYKAYGSTLMAGVGLSPLFGETDFRFMNNFYRDYGSRMYFMKSGDVR